MKQHSVKLNAILNMIKQICTVIFPLITVPYATRVLSTDSYGLVSYAFSIVSYFSLVAALGCSTYAVREGAMIRRDRKKLNEFSNEIFTITLISTAFSFLALLISIVIFDEFRSLKSLLFLFSANFILMTLGADWINTIFEDFMYLTIRYIVFQVVGLVLVFILVRQTDDYFWYAFTLVVATGGANVLNLFYIRKYVHLKPVLHINWKRHLKPIMVLFSSTVAGTIYVNSDITIIGIIQDNNSVAMYSVASKVYVIIKQLLLALIAAGAPRAALYLGEGRIDDLKSLYRDLRDTMFVIVPPAAIGMIMLSKELLTVVGGAKYTQGYVTFIILSVAIIFSCFANLFMSIIIIPYRQEKITLIATAISAVINIILNIILIPVLDYNAAAITTLISEIVVFAIFLAKAGAYIRLPIKLKECIAIAFGCGAVILLCLLGKIMMKALIVRMVFDILLSVIVYFIILLIFKVSVITDMYHNLKNKWIRMK